MDEQNASVRSQPNTATADKAKSKNELSGEIDSGNRHGDISPDDTPRLDALREAARQHGDAFLVKSDLEDKDQREATPGTREQP